jgi:hypothetical protein
VTDEELTEATTEVFAAIGANETPSGRWLAGRRALLQFQQRVAREAAEVCRKREAHFRIRTTPGAQHRENEAGAIATVLEAMFGLDPKPGAEGE